MDKQGNTDKIEKSDSSYGFPQEKSDSVSFTFHSEPLMNCYCFAKDKAHAVKIANERRIEYLAANSWGKPL